MIKKIARRVIAKFSDLHLSMILAQSAYRQPLRISQRLNRENWKLRSQYSSQRLHCPICGSEGTMFFDMPDRKLRADHGIGILRETLNCKSCGSTMRHRTMAVTLLKVVNQRTRWQLGTIQQLADATWDFRILDTDSFSPIAVRLKHNRNYTTSEYMPAQAFGAEVAERLFNVDLQRICFADGSFDYVMSSDVMEHVPDDQSAHREIHRCLKAGGAYLFTVPYDHSMQANRMLAAIQNGQHVFYETPHYHGDPLTGQIVAYRIYGRQLIEDLSHLGFDARFDLVQNQAAGIFGGDVFVASKKAQP